MLRRRIYVFEIMVSKRGTDIFSVKVASMLPVVGFKQAVPGEIE